LDNKSMFLPPGEKVSDSHESTPYCPPLVCNFLF
jgi:hypothetical protein